MILLKLELPGVSHKSGASREVGCLLQYILTSTLADLELVFTANH